jgi:large subunit ribosomal protein L23
MKAPQLIVDRILLTEKGVRLSEQHDKYVFQVAPGANKLEIKQAVQQLFKVTVTGVNTLHRAGKEKRNRRQLPGFTSASKRAVVTLKKGDKIDFK